MEAYKQSCCGRSEETVNKSTYENTQAYNIITRMFRFKKLFSGYSQN